MDCREEFEKWVVNHNQAEIKWIGHSYANAYMAAQYEGFKAAWNTRAGIVIDRDKVPEGLNGAVERSQKGLCREGDKRIVVEAAALLAEKVEG